jgi:hypothetical protein
MEVYRPKMPQAQVGGPAFILTASINTRTGGACPWRGSSRSTTRRAYQRTDRGNRWFLVGAVPVSDEQGNILKWHGMAAHLEDTSAASGTKKMSAPTYGQSLPPPPVAPTVILTIRSTHGGRCAGCRASVLGTKPEDVDHGDGI